MTLEEKIDTFVLAQGNQVGSGAELAGILKQMVEEMPGPPGPQGPQGPQGNTGSSVDYPYELVNNLTTDDPTKGLSAAQGKVLDGKISQLGQEVNGNEFALFNEGKISPKYVANSYVLRTNGTFTAYNGWTRTDYMNISPFASIIITTTGTMTYNAFYDKNKAFIKAFNLSSGANNITLPPNACYMALSASDASMRAVTFAIGDYRFPTLKDLADRLIKLEWMAASGSLNPGEYGYNTSSKKIRYCNADNVVSDVPFYSGAVYTFNNKLYVYNGDTLVLTSGGRFCSNPEFEEAVNEMLVSGFDATFVNSIDSYRFTPAALGGVDYIRLSAGATNYDFRRVNDGVSCVLFFRYDVADKAEQGKGIFVLLDRTKFTAATGAVTLDSAMVLSLGTMPSIREHLTGLTTEGLTFVNLTLVESGKGIGLTGVLESTTNSAFSYSAPVQVKKGDRIFVATEGAVKFTVIAKTDSTASFYTPAVPSANSWREYTYICDEDGYVAFTIYTASQYYVRKVSSDVYAQIQTISQQAAFFDCADLYISRAVYYKALTYDDLIARYDALIAEYPALISKTKLGESVNGQDIFEIKITSGPYNKVGRRGGRDAEIAKPKFMIATGTHGYEPGTPNSLFLFVRELVTGSPALSAIRNNVELRIIPCVNPDGYDAYTRTNANGVDINRNYNYNWTLHDEGEQNYSGPSAASEPETQIVQNWINNNTDAVFCLDWHQSSFNEEMSCLGGISLVEASGQAALKRMYLEAINGIAGMLISRRGVADNSVFAYTYNEAASAHGYFNGYVANAGIPGGCLETPEQVNGTGANSALTISVGADIIGNFCKKAEEKYSI